MLIRKVGAFLFFRGSAAEDCGKLKTVGTALWTSEFLSVTFMNMRSSKCSPQTKQFAFNSAAVFLSRFTVRQLTTHLFDLKINSTFTVQINKLFSHKTTSHGMATILFEDRDPLTFFMNPKNKET